MLIALFLVKHFIADFVLQSDCMANAKGQRRDWADWLFAHCMIHSVLTLVVLVLFVPLVEAVTLASFDHWTHFIIDRTKAVYSRDLSPRKKAFWNALGFDQLLHGLTYVAIAAIINGGI
jgi:hypothetical protein